MPILRTSLFDNWLDSLTDPIAQRAVAARIVRASSGNLGKVRSLGDGVSEMKIDVGQGYRLYYTMRQQTIIYLLNGGDKSSQKRDITTAKGMAAMIP